MSVLADFARMRIYRNRAAEFEELADKALLATAQRRYRTVARHTDSWRTARSEPTKLEWLSTLIC